MTNQEAIERIKAALDMDDIEGHCYILTKDVDRKAFHLAIKALEQTRPKGKWISDKSRQALQDCSICGALSIAKTNYCSNCGGDMRGDQE